MAGKGTLTSEGGGCPEGMSTSLPALFDLLLLLTVGEGAWREPRKDAGTFALHESERAVLRKLRDDENLSDIRLIKLVRVRHLGVGLGEAKRVVDKL